MELIQGLTFSEFVEWMDTQGFYLMPKETHINKEHKFMNKEFAYMISDRELLSLFVEFCDNNGYYINVDIVAKSWWYSISNDIGDLIYTNLDTDTLNSRTEATQAAIAKVFELMENSNV